MYIYMYYITLIIYTLTIQKDGMTALHVAAAKGNTECVKAMLEALKHRGVSKDEIKRIVNIEEKVLPITK